MTTTTARTWDLIHAERAALADDLRDLDDARWATPSTLALVMAMTGRSAYCDELTGAGVATLRARS